MNYQSLKNHLKYVNPTTLQNKIRRFRNLPIKNLTKREIAAEIGEVLSFDTPFGRQAVLVPMSSHYPQGTRFYRVRNLAESDTAMPPRDMRFIEDAWNPPTHVVKQGRVNLAKESLLYTSPLNPLVAIAEMKVEENSNFSLIVYEAVSQINVTVVGSSFETSELTEDELFKLSLLNDFLTHEFTRDVGMGTEYLYKISETIAKDYFDLPPHVHDAWQYPSVAERPSANVCFRPQVAKEKLRLVGIQIASYVRQPTGMTLQVKYTISGIGQDRVLLCHKIGSPQQLIDFPELKLPS